MSDSHLPPSGSVRPTLPASRPGTLPPMRPVGSPAAHQPGAAPKMTVVPNLGKPKDDLSSIALEDEVAKPAAGGEQPKSKIMAFGVRDVAHGQDYKRHAPVTGRGAVHLRTFHGRLSDEGLQFMDDKINEWLEAHPEIEVKFATTTVGMYEGKIKDLALIVNIWY